MTIAVRAAWLLCAAFFATILSSILHTTHVGLVAHLLLLAAAVIAAVRPDLGLVLVAGTAPVAYYLAIQFWNSGVGWAETITCAVLTGVSLNAAVFRLNRALPVSVSAPAVLFGAIVAASLIAGLGVLALRLGPGFTQALVIQLTREYFFEVRGFPALHAGLLLLEGVLLFAAAARIAAHDAADRRFLYRVAAATAASATLAACLNFDKLVRSAWLEESFWASLIDLAGTVRLDELYGDFNAAGSYFVMAAFVAAVLAVRASGPRRIAWTLSTITIAVALWLTSSRMAVLAGLVAPGAVFVIMEISRGRARALRAVAVTAAGLLVLVLVAVALPQRGNQKSSFLALDVRIGLLQTGGRMIASRPVVGIGLGEFYRRTGEFSSPDLIAKFPVVATGENAHNNFLQVAAELGIAGGLLFAWLVAAALVAIARHAVRTGTDETPGDPRSDPRDPRDPRPDPRPKSLVPRLLMAAALVAFALTMLGGHPLLIPEPGFVFWTLLGAATGSAAAPGVRHTRLRWLVPIGLIVIALTVPWRLRATTEDADFEHQGIGVSQWQHAPDGTGYREAAGRATLFVPTGAFLVSVYPLTDQPVRLELKLDGRVADIVALAPRQWNDIRRPARTEATNARYGRLDLRVLDNDQTALWITKVQPLK